MEQPELIMAEALIYKSLEPIRNQIKKIWLLNKSINIIHGISKALLFVLPLLAFACLADWVWDIEEETPLPIRLIMTASWLSLLIVSLASYVVLPGIKSFKENDTALKIEQTFPEFDHRLITVLQLSRPEARFDKKSEKLLAELTGEVVACYPNFNFNKALELKKLTDSSYKFAPVFLFVMFSLLFAHNTAKALIERQLLLNTPIPRNTTIINLPEKIVLAEGEEAIIVFDLSLTKGYTPSMGKMRWKNQEGKTLLLPIEPDENGQWKATLASSIEDGVVTVRIGDGRAGPLPVIRKNRPSLEMVSAKLLMPEWFGKRPDGSPYETIFPKGDVDGIEGGTVQVEFKSSQPLKEATLIIKHADTNLTPETMPVTLSENKQTFTVRFNLKLGNVRYQVNISNRDGLESNPNWQRKLTVLQTKEPLVSLLPEQIPGLVRVFGKDEDTEIDGLPVLIGKQFRVAYKAESNSGLLIAKFRYRINEKGDWSTLPLQEFKAGSEKLGKFLIESGSFENSSPKAVIDFYPLPSEDPWKTPDRRLAGGRFDFQIGPLKNIRVGDKIEYFVEVTDMNPVDPKSGQSEIFVKEVAGVDELLAWWRRKEKETEKLMQLKNKQATVFEGFLPNLPPKP
ncbi:MAG: hypothetical protein RLZ61_627 [Planctomycetota bacterium]|jgi:hypothetical protein